MQAGQPRGDGSKSGVLKPRILETLVNRTSWIVPLALALIPLAAPCPADAAEADEAGSDGPRLEFHGLELAPDIKFYVNYAINLSEDDGEAAGKNNKFSIGRAYLGLKLKIADWISVRTTYDASMAKDVGKKGELDDDGEVESSGFQGSMLARMKYAYVSLKIEALDAQVRFGMAHTPYIDWMEHRITVLFKKILPAKFRVVFINEVHQWTDRVSHYHWNAIDSLIKKGPK